MELKEFVSETLRQIADGVLTVKDYYKENGGIVNPKKYKVVSEGIKYGKEFHNVGEQIDMICDVEFEVSLTEGSKEGSTGGLGVMLGYINVGGKINSDEERKSLTKVKFNIPVILP